MYLEHGTIRFIASGARGSDVLQELRTAGHLPPWPNGLDPLIVVLPERAAELQAVRRMLPGDVLRSIRDAQTDEILFLTYETEASTANSALTSVVPKVDN